MYGIVIRNSAGERHHIESEDKSHIEKFGKTLEKAIAMNTSKSNAIPTINVNNYNTINTGKQDDAKHEPLKIQNEPEITREPTLDKNDVMRILLKAAMNNEGRLSVTQGVLETGLHFTDVENILKGMVDSGYVYIDNNARNGVIEYVFKEVL